MKTKRVLKTGSSDYDQGYTKGLEDAIITIIKLLSDNNINLNAKEFYKEYKLLKKEGVI